MTFLIKIIYAGTVVLTVPHFESLPVCQEFGDNVVLATSNSEKPKTYECEIEE